MNSDQYKPMVHLDEDTLNEYLDNSLDPSSRKAADLHLEGCADCQRRVNDLSLVFQALDGVHDVAISSDLAAEVMVHIQVNETASRLPLWLATLITFQVFVIFLMTVALWPSASHWLVQVGQKVPWALNDLPVEYILKQPIKLIETWTASITQAAGSIGSPLFLSGSQWILVITLALIIWLVGNSVLLRNGSQRSK